MDARLKLIAGNGGTFPDLLEQKNMGGEGNKTDSTDGENNKKNDEKTNTGTENINSNTKNTSTDIENANTDTSGNAADESTNKGPPTLKEPPSGRTDVQPPEDMNL